MVFEALIWFWVSVCHYSGRPWWYWLFGFLYHKFSQSWNHLCAVLKKWRYKQSCHQGVWRHYQAQCIVKSGWWHPLFLSISVHCHLPFIFFPNNTQYTPKQKQQNLPTGHSVQPGLKTYCNYICSSFPTNLSMLPRVHIAVQRWPVWEVPLLFLWHLVQDIKNGELLFTYSDIFCFISALWWAWSTIQPDRHFLWTISSSGREHYRDQPSCGVLFGWTEC